MPQLALIIRILTRFMPSLYSTATFHYCTIPLFRVGFRVESSRVRVEHRTGPSCSKLEILEFDRVEHRVEPVKYRVDQTGFSTFDSSFRARNSCSTRVESSRTSRTFEHARSKCQLWHCWIWKISGEIIAMLQYKAVFWGIVKAGKRLRKSYFQFKFVYLKGRQISFKSFQQR